MLAVLELVVHVEAGRAGEAAVSGAAVEASARRRVLGTASCLVQVVVLLDDGDHERHIVWAFSDGE